MRKGTGEGDKRDMGEEASDSQGMRAGAGGRHLGNERENRKEALDTLSFYRTAFPRTDTEP